MVRAVDFARWRGAGHVRLEVTNVNAAAIRAYRRMGFAFSGWTPASTSTPTREGERALCMGMSCP